ncbi:hypothetical protein [Streptomyces eurythermus]|uniref:hypothetical protein n=1 Tax=Streptomyces eurythermus TaxID=42237 RepID=UPI0036D2E014
MDTPPAPTADTRDQQLADLRAAIQRAIPLLSFAAGREATTAPRQAGLLLAAADDMMQILNRTSFEL